MLLFSLDRPKSTGAVQPSRLAILAMRADALADILRDTGRRAEAVVAMNLADALRELDRGRMRRVA